MQVILKEDVHNLGKSGDLVNVKPGYGRNYLLPQGKAVAATRKNVAQLEHEKKLIAARNAKLRRDARPTADKRASMETTTQRQGGEGEKLFGSVSTRDIEEALAERGIKLDRKKIVLDEPIRSLGVYTLDVRLAREVT